MGKICTILFCIITVAALCTGCGGRKKRHSWQKKEDFVVKRQPEFNQFVQDGGMAKKRKEMTIEEMKMQNKISNTINNTNEPLKIPKDKTMELSNTQNNQ